MNMSETNIPLEEDVDLLPKQEKDWFEDIKPIQVKNVNLVNIHKPIGGDKEHLNKNNRIDNQPIPKIVISPWLNSCIEVDKNMKPLI